MAQMIPGSIPSKASQGEKALFKILCDQLPDDSIVWYEPRVNNYILTSLFWAQHSVY
jgi:hypothetical protein